MSLSSRTDMDRYLRPPYSTNPLPDNYMKGLIGLGLMALLSVLSCASLLVWITYRLINWRRYYSTYIGYNQYVILIYQLLLADLIQSIGFAFSFHWMRVNKIMATSPACFTQGFFVNLGDVSSGLFVLAIAVHTYVQVVRGRKLGYTQFLAAIVGIWLFALLLSIVGPALHGRLFFTQAGVPWCFTSRDYEDKRLWLHYLWIFIAEFGSILMYLLIYIHLTKRVSAMSGHNSASSKQISKAALYMIVYPIVYIILTLPLATGRMISMAYSNKDRASPLSLTFYVTAASMITSCGWLDTLLYTLTRRVLIKEDISGARSGGDSAGAPGAGNSWALQSMDVNTSRSVTITGGKRARNSLMYHHYQGGKSPMADGSGGDGGGGGGGTNISKIPGNHYNKSSSADEKPSATITYGSDKRLSSGKDSIDSIASNPGYAGGMVLTETKVEVNIAPIELSEDGTSKSSTWVPRHETSMRC